MSLHEFIGRLSRVQVSENDRKWMPKWLAEYASALRQDAAVELTLNEPDVLTFLRGLRDRGVPAWQRLQATRTLDWYQNLVGKQQRVDFSAILTKLQEIAQRERRSPENVSATIPGEGEPGLIDETEPTSVQQLRRKMRMLHHPRSTEDTYIHCAVRSNRWLSCTVVMWRTGLVKFIFLVRWHKNIPARREKSCLRKKGWNGYQTDTLPW